MTDYDELPKGMKKKPDEYHTDEEGKPMNHSIHNYSAAIRKAIEAIDGLEVTIRQVEIIEAHNAPALISLAIEIGEK